MMPTPDYDQVLRRFAIMRWPVPPRLIDKYRAQQRQYALQRLAMTAISDKEMGANVLAPLEHGSNKCVCCGEVKEDMSYNPQLFGFICKHCADIARETTSTGCIDSVSLVLARCVHQLKLKEDQANAVIPPLRMNSVSTVYCPRCGNVKSVRHISESAGLYYCTTCKDTFEYQHRVLSWRDGYTKHAVALGDKDVHDIVDNTTCSECGKHRMYEQYYLCTVQPDVEREEYMEVILCETCKQRKEPDIRCYAPIYSLPM